MAQKKAGEVEAFLSRPDFSFPIVLLYGPDPGLVSERAAVLAERSGVDLSDPFNAVSLQADELERDIGRLYDEAATVSLFGGQRLIRVRGAGNGRNLAQAVADLSQKPLEAAVVVIEAGDLKKSAPLRQSAERGHAAMALPCYQDEGRALDRVIDEEFKAADLTIDREARAELKARLGADRMASRGEVRKLCLYALGTGAVTETDVRAVVGDVSAETVHETIDAAVSGEVKRLPHLIDRLTAAGTATFQLHQGLLRYFQQLQAMRAQVEEGGEPVGRVVERARPHFRRKAAMETALTAWPLAAIAPICRRIEADTLASRKESGLALAITRETVMAVAVEAARHRAR